MNNKLFMFLENSWCKESSKYKNSWSKDLSFVGQSDVTSLIINDYFNGKIMYVYNKNIKHYFNLIDNRIYDISNPDNILKIDYLEMMNIDKKSLLKDNDVNKRYIVLSNKVQFQRYKKKIIKQKVLLTRNTRLKKFFNGKI